jgi:hypothetical protein
MLSNVYQHDATKLTKWLDEKSNDVLLSDVVNTYNVCGKMFFEMRYNVMGDGPLNSLE